MSTKEIKYVSPNASEEEIHALLERCLIDKYLKGKGYTRDSLKSLPDEVARQLMKEASTYASGKLSEIEIRARFTKDLQDTGHSLES
jgi:hypothetical protein